MREIKFRNLYNGTWWHVGPYDDDWEQFWAITNCGTVQQFTNLKDIENKDVYEGDIVQFLTFAGRGVVTYAPPQFLASGHSLQGYEFKIIGNIYEHPEIVIESAL